MLISNQTLVYKNTFETKVFQKYCSPNREAKITDDIYFSGLSRCMKKKLLDDFELNELPKKYPKSNGCIGSLPKEWIDKIPKEQRKEKIKNFYSEFGNLALKIRKIKYNKRHNQEISENINNLFLKTGLISKNQQIKISLIGSGSFGDGYLIEGLDNFDNQYVVKIFKNLTTFYTHGILAEANRGLFWKKNAGKITQYTDLYFADAQNGYLVTKYIKTDASEPKRIVDPAVLGINIIDNGNKIAGRIFDFGGLFAESPILANNTKARNIYKKIGKTSFNDRTILWKNIFDKKAQSQYNDILLGLLESVKFIPHEKKAECLSKFAGIPDNTIKIQVFKYISDIPIHERKIFFVKFAKTADNELIKVMLKKLIYLPKDEKFQIKEILKPVITNDKKSWYKKFIDRWKG